MGLIWGAIAPDGKSKKKGFTKIQVRVIEYTIDADAGKQTYRLITSLMDITLFPALLLAAEYHDSVGNRKYDWRTQNPSKWTQNSYPFSQTPWSRSRNLRLAARTLCSAVFNVYCSTASRNIAIASGFYWHTQSHSTGDSWFSGCSTRATPFFFSRRESWTS